MARTSGPETRRKLLRAAEELFAAKGVDGALTRDITRLAGQSNPSAVQYHFGSRQGLLDAVMAGRQERTEAALAPRLAALLAGPAGVSRPEPEPREFQLREPEPRKPQLRELLAALIAAEATELATDSGRRCLLISAQLSRESGVRTRTPHPTLAGTGSWRLIRLVEDRLDRLPEPVRLERLDLTLTLIGAALGDRARQYLDGTQPLTDEELFLADLVGTTTAMLRAPAPGAPPRLADSDPDSKGRLNMNDLTGKTVIITAWAPRPPARRTPRPT
ncbi:TetR family transcriptional regulator [Streptomyces sp. H10-C2]|uniref:TetR family transcriptional regulator n=1 Tax=unclassified Streptomyces TaxID=2593676 RepID=UPI0024BB6E89|nr:MULTISPECIES: TetR family transcriptional regulator [unclassified Streptomyces]MDJ0341367.1 TetR family transcriptional regulator [Streptomyces sp. PH10-H1]MDJ0370962.1 TetR family transcriptional regulator [Streptomyces sp. H10-C2]